MKIGFIGNSGNYSFMLAKAMKKMGIAVVFIVTSNHSLDRPEYRYEDITVPYPDWIYDAGHLDLWDYNAKSSPQICRVLDILRKCDAVVMNHGFLCLSQSLPVPTIALLTGTDILTLSRYSYIDERLGDSGSYNKLSYFKYNYFYRNRITAQRFGIKNAFLVITAPPKHWPAAHEIIDDIGVDDSRKLYLGMADTSYLKYTPLPDNRVPRVFSSTRITWIKSKGCKYADIDYKGTDIMVMGLSKFVREFYPLDIHLVKKGAHIAETIDLIEKEGLSPYVTWHGEMSQSEVVQQYKLADVIMEQFDKKGSVGMSALDSMCIGRPVIANSTFFDTFTASATPFCQASTPEEVCWQLERLLNNKIEREKVSIASRNYVEKYYSTERAATEVLKNIDLYFAQNRKVDITKYYSLYNDIEKEMDSAMMNKIIMKSMNSLSRIYNVIKSVLII